MKNKTHEELLIELGNIAKELGWVIAIPISDDESGVQGMVIGDEVYVLEVLNDIKEKHDIMNKPISTDDSLH